MPEIPTLDAAGRAELASLRTRVADRAEAAPDSVALVHGVRHLTYRELDLRARRLAARLAADGVRPEERVGVAVDRSPELIVALLAVQEAGGAYLPLDPSYPEDRLAFMAADAGVERLLCDRAAAELPFARHLRRLDPGDLPCDRSAGGGRAAAKPGSLAYVIYTSGSTGRPKGVMVPHAGLANLAEAELEVFGTGPDDRVLQFAPASFDASVFEVAMALGAGAALVLAEREELLPGPGLARLLARERVTRVTLPPSVLAALPEEALPCLDTLISAGEALPGELVARWGAGRRMWNAFGPTETTVWATVGGCRRGEPRPPIGEAIPGLSVHLVDERLEPVGAGERGEIVVGGAGVARGYLDRPALTAERFVPGPFADAGEEGARLYRTGDLGRRLADGRIEYLGRADHQVKVRGHRVEPGEVEAVLGRHPAVRSCAVVAERDPVDPHGGYRLAAFVVLREDGAAGSGRALSDALCAYLAERLPSHLVPARVARLDALPLLPNGKVDRAALLETDGERVEAERARRPPTTATETALAAVWRELLGVDQPSLDDDLFDLGGHSILVGRLISRVRRALGVELTARAVFEARTLGALAAAVDSAAEPPLPPIETAPRDRPMPLTFPQERIWFLEELSPDNLAYNAQVCVHFQGSLDVRALARALAEVVRRHEVYRSRFFAVDGTPYQEPLDAAECPVPLPVIDLSALPERRRDPERERRTREEIAHPFDLSRPPLGRWTLFRETFDRTTLLQVEHHLAHDGWSFAVLLAELRRLYEAFAAGRPSPLPEVPVQVGDYAVWQRRLMSGERLRRTLDYWRGRLAGAPPVLALPTDRPRPPVQSFRGDAVRFDLDPELADGLRRLARDCGGTLFGVMRAGFDTLLSRYTGEDDLVVGSGAANRRTEGSEAMIGMVVNTLPVRVELTGAPTFRELVARVGEALVGAHAHEDVPFDRLVDALGVARDASRNPLVQVLFSFHDSPVPDLSFPGLVGRIAEQHNRTAKTDLNVVVIPRAEQRVGMMGVDRPAEAQDAAQTAVTVIWEYATDLFDRSTMERMTRCFRTLLAAAVAAPAAPALDLELLSPAERRQLLSEWRGRIGDYPDDASLADLFAARAAERPDAEALVTAGADRRRAMSYGTLAAAADRLARRLRQSGVRRGDRVALALDRSFDAVVGMTAVLRAGGAYVPLDPSYPAERLRFMLEDSGASRIVTRAEVLEAAPALAASGLPWVPVEGHVEAPSDGPAEAADALFEPVGGGDLAYVIYTSGSTGTPKGVAVPHRAVARLVLGTVYTPFGPDETFLHAASVSFDAATYEVWGALLHGARLAVLPPGPQTPDRLAEAMARERPTALFLTTGLFNQLAEDRIDAFTPLTHLMTGGEAASPDHFRRVLAAHPGLSVSNVYGPTENTTFSTHHPMAGPDEVGEPVPIGGAIGHTTVLVADRALRPVPAGVVGELLVGGDGLAWGYHGRPALTAATFLPDPFAGRAGERVYRTGDLVRRSGRADLAGAIEFVGRNDSQVKVRGFRIEPGEVELALEAHPEVSEAIVLARELRGDKALVAYVVPSAGTVADAGGELAKRLRAHLADRLPAHAVPQAIVAVPRFPLTANGKVDRRALPDPETATAAAVGSVPPRGPVEEMVAAVWSEVLEQSPIGAHDDFFHLGGHSLAATRVVSRLRRMTGLDLPLVELFESPTVAGLARAIRSLGRVAGTAGKASAGGVPILGPAPGGPRSAPYSAPASFAQERLWFLDRFEAEGALYNVPASVRLRGRLVPASLRRALHDLERRHEGLRTVFAEERAAAGTPDGLAAAVRQAIQLPSSPPLPVVDLSALAPERRDGELARVGRDDARRRFDLARGPLWRACLVRLAGDDHALLLTLHHVITDGWSMTILYRDLWNLYAAAEEGGAGDPPEPAVRYADFARWQREWLRGPVLAAEVDWWRERLTGAPTVLPLPLDRPRPAVRSGRGGRVSTLLPPAVLSMLRACARTHEASLFMVLLAGLQAWLARATGEDDVPVGTPVANRGQAETEGIVGFFVNTLVLRTDLAGDPTFVELLERVRGVALAAFAHQELPFEKLVEALAPVRDTAVTPLYQVSLALQNAGREVPGPPGMEVSRLPVEIPVAKLDLSLSFADVEEGLELRVSYDRDLLDRTTVLRTIGQLRALLWAAVLRPETRLSDLPVVTTAERRTLLEVSEAPPPKPGGAVDLAGSFHAAFRRWVERTPDAVALEEGEARWSYRALDRRSAALGARLRAAGVGPESRIALLVETSAEAIVALLAVHAAGGAFVPLDPGQPEERLRFQVTDSGAEAVLTGRGSEAARIAGGVAVVPIDDAPEDEAPVPFEPPKVDGGHLAYVSYTSGSTGKPKGVAVEHRQLLSYVAAIAERLEIGPGDALATLSSLAADLGHTAVFPALATGGRLVVLPRETATDPAAMAAAAHRYRYDLLKIVPSHLSALLAGSERLEDVLPARWLVLGGEALPGELAARLVAAGGPRVVNHYGPTETTVGVLTRAVGADRPTVPLGRPLPGRSVHVLDARLVPVPAGVAGEIVIGGEGVARGYLGRPALTAARFVPDAFSGREGARLYRTGDRARRRPDGEIEFLGRVDAQVKVRGFRIEPGEVEAALLRQPGVCEAAVMLTGDGGEGEALTAFLATAPEAAVEPASLRCALARSLPDAMVPSRFVTLDRLPRLANGKIDRRALSVTGADRYAASGAESAAGSPAGPGPGDAPPATPLEELVAEAWGEVLGTRPVGASGADFFALGGHSLLAIRAVARLYGLTGVEVPLRQLFETPTVAGLARWIGERLAGDRDGAAAEPIPRLADGSRAPASFAQERLWFLDRLGTDRRSYGVPTALAIDGLVRPAMLARALGGVVRRHEPLRTNLVAPHEADGVIDLEIDLELDPDRGTHVVQVVRPAGGVSLPVVDLSGLPEAPRAAAQATLLAAESTRPFDLAAAPPLRAALLRTAPEAHLLLVVVHHVAFDAWSRPLYLRELAALYERGGDDSALPALPIGYRDYAAWQRRTLDGERLDALVARARERLAGAPRHLELPADRPRPAVRSERGGAARRALAPGLAEDLRRLAREGGASLFMTLSAGFAAFLARLTGADDLLLGTPIAGRSRPETGPLIGLFVDTLVLRADLGSDPPFERALERARADALAAFAGADLPFERLVEALEPERDLSHAPLFQVGFGFEARVAPVPPPAGLSWRPVEVPRTTAKLDLALVAREEGSSLVLQADHSADLFDATTVARWLRQVETLLRAAAEAPGTRLSELPLLAAAERHQALREWADGGPVAGASDRPATLHAGFAAQVVRMPDAVAVSGGSVRWSYRELDRRAEAVARRLSALGVGPEVPVGVAVERSPWLVAALLGVLRAGGAYVALDPSYPSERLAAVLAGCGTDRAGGAPWVVTSAAVEARLPAALADGRRVRVEDLDVPRDGLRMDGRSGSGNLAYVLFTSGSTGQPKGVSIEHRSADAFLAWAGSAFAPEELAGTLGSTSIAFDLSVFEMFAPLVHGGTVHLVDDALALADPVRCPDAPRVTLLNTVPSAAAELVRLGALPPSVRALALAGEPLPRSLAEAARAAVGGVDGGGLRVLDLYGPSEDTTYSTWGAVVPGERREPTIGRPLAGSRAYVLDANLRPVPPGAIGELCLAGAGLARGYLRRPAETAAAFLPDPFLAASDGVGGRLYRTGDLARHLPDGRLDFLGRRDHQVKLRGFRIELGEIEVALCENPGVREAVAVVAGDAHASRRLVAYVGTGESAEASSTAQAPLDPRSLRERLSRRLPAYMVPAAIAVLPALPRTPNGKVDRKALPAPDAPEAPDGSEGLARRLTPTEELLVPVWESVLEGAPGAVESGRIGRDADFFALGGHSLLAARLIAAVRRSFDVDLPLAAVFEAPTLAGLARRIEAAARREAAGAVPPPVTRAGAEERERPVPLSWAQRRLWFLHRMEGRRLGSAYHVTQAVHLEGELSPPALERALAEIVARHEALRTRIVESADGEASQVVDPPPHSRRLLPTTDFAAVPEATRQAALARWIAAETEQPFALGAEPPVRWRLARLGSEEHVLLVVAHHVAVDLGSFAVVYRELSALYRAFAEGEPSPLAPPPLQYADWTLWQHRLARPDGDGGSVLATQLAWWRERLAGAPTVLEVPSDRPRPAEQSYRGARVETSLDPATAERLAAFCRETGATPFMALLTVFGTLLGRTAGRDELIVGTPVAGRAGEELDDAVGLFGNVLALRLDLGPQGGSDGGPGGGRAPGLAELATRVRALALAAYARQDVPFEQVVEALEIERDLSRTPLVQVTFSIQDPPVAGLSLPGVAARALPSSRRSVQYDLALQVADASGPEPRIALDYAADLYDEATARALAGRFVRLLAAGLAAPAAPVDALPWLSEAEERALLAAGAGPVTPAAEDGTASTLHGRVAARAARHPERPAVGSGEAVVRYGDLVAEARRIGHRLAEIGVGAEAPVGVLLERTSAMVAALLGVLEAGGSYLPLDPAYPPERIARTLADAGARVLVTEEALADRVDPADRPGVRRVVIDGSDREAIAAARATPVGAPASGASRAYVIYTSGSTGRPKGVEVSHAAVLAFLDAMARRPGLGPDDVALATTTVAFDISILEIFLPLVVGARVELVDRETAADGAALGERMRGVTVAQATPTSWRMLLDAGWKGAAAGGRAPRVLSGGEALDRELAERLLGALGGDREPGELWNVYGPTETTVWSSAGRVTAEALAAGTCPIGDPIAGTRLYVVDPRGALCPPGVPGELRIGGAGVARGYLGRPALTAERFTPDPFASADGSPGARSYRTGDLARWREAGGAWRLECLGRIDQQVKIRGHRIEPGEIEAALTLRDDVSRAVVAPFPRGGSAAGRRLAAWLVLAPGRPEPTVEDLRSGLEKALPPYMVPAAFVVLPELPLQASGKVDRTALPEPDGLRLATDTPYVEPSSDAERVLAAIWREVLGVERVGAGDRFFHLGGDSILALQVAARAARAGWSLAVRDFFRHATLGELAGAIRRATGDREQALEAIEAPLPDTLDFRQTGLSDEELDDLLGEIG